MFVPFHRALYLNIMYSSFISPYILNGPDLMFQQGPIWNLNFAIVWLLDGNTSNWKQYEEEFSGHENNTRLGALYHLSFWHYVTNFPKNFKPELISLPTKLRGGENTFKINCHELNISIPTENCVQLNY